MKAIDSDVIIDFLRGEKSAVEKIKTLNSEEIITTQINLYEVMRGVYEKKESAVCLDFFTNITILDIDSRSALQAAKQYSILRQEGKILESNDCLIAGTLIANNCKKIVTRNKKHFTRFKELKIINY